MQSNLSKLKVCFLSTYPPRECGIATYTKDVIDSIKANDPSFNYSVVALDSNPKRSYPKEVKIVIDQKNDSDYIKAAEYVNNSEIGLVSIQHEFGIFGGFNGNKLLLFLKHLKKPSVITLHTTTYKQDSPFKIVPKRYKSRRKLLEKILSYVEGVTVMIESSKKYLVNDLNIPENKIEVIEHGAPVITREEILRYHKNKTNYCLDKDDFVITTFGLISPKKGLEYVIKSLPQVIKDNPQIKIKYLIAGTNHPLKPKKYLADLKKTSLRLGVKNNVVFYTKYLTKKEIYKILSFSDIYVTPYYVKEQASSGTLSYAVACGRCIISTPYIFALDILGKNKIGEFIDFRDDKSISEKISFLIHRPQLRQEYEHNSAKLGKTILWPEIGVKFLNFFNYISEKQRDD